MARANTREAILSAALECFLAQGVAETSIADLRARSGASTGSIYHFFGSKEDLAVALCAESLTSWAQAVAAVPPRGSARDTVTSMVAGLIDWAVTHDRHHRFLVDHAYLAPKAAQRSDMVDALMTARLTQERILRDLMAKGALRSMPWDLARALILGPAEAYLRARAHGEATTLPEEARDSLADAAWRAVAAEPRPAAHSATLATTMATATPADGRGVGSTGGGGEPTPRPLRVPGTLVGAGSGAGSRPTSTPRDGEGEGSARAARRVRGWDLV